MQLPLLKRVVEAILLAAAQPLSLAQLAALFTEEDAVENEQLLEALQQLMADCSERGVELKEVASGYRYQICEDVHPWVTRLWTERQTKYSRALLETLALIAYRQPITRAEIEQIRGVAVSSSIIKTLEEREWVRVVGYRDVPGRPALFGTSRSFLDYFSLKSLDELPPLAEIRDLDEYDPQLDLAPVIPPSLELPPDDDIDAESNAAAHVVEADTAVASPAASSDVAAPTDSVVETDTASVLDVPAPSAEADAAHAISTDAVEPLDDAAATDDGRIDATHHDSDDSANDWPDSDLPAADFADTPTPSAVSHFDSPADDEPVDPTEPTTSDDVPEHTA